MASKYKPLTRWLRDQQRDERRVTFAAIEALLGFKLPDSARKHAAWWANSDRGSAGSASWLAAGWTACEVSLEEERVVFRRGVAAPPASPPVSPACPTSAYPTPGDPVETVLSIAWAEMGCVALDGGGKPVFPKVPVKTPAVYRFTVRVDGHERQYVGEAVDLARRFGNYRNPGPTQETSKRIHAILVEALRAGGEVSVAVVFPGTARIGDATADLMSKTIRCLFESAAIVSCGPNTEMLNAAD
jgi:hypothetical protein